MKTDFFSNSKLPPYLFEAIHILKTEISKKGVEIIDFGMGNPDLSPPKMVLEEMAEIVKKPESYRYSVVGGINELKKAHCFYYKNRFGVELDYEKETLITIGAKEGLTSLALALSEGDDYFVVPDPSYPIHAMAFRIAKNKVVKIASKNAWDFFEKFKNLVENSSKKPLAVIVSFPSNPTTECVELDFYQELVDFCKIHQIYIISDIAYAEIYFDEKFKPVSILQAQGAKDVAIEFSTISKTFSMGGARIGFACGNQNLIEALYKMKSYLDYGSFLPLQIVASKCLYDFCGETYQYLQDLRAKYKKRAEILIEKLNNDLNWQVAMPKATMFVWTKLPQKFAHLTSFEFCKKLLEEKGVALSPGSGFGENGEGFVRFSLIHDQEKIDVAISRIKEFFDEN